MLNALKINMVSQALVKIALFMSLFSLTVISDWSDRKTRRQLGAK